MSFENKRRKSAAERKPPAEAATSAKPAETEKPTEASSAPDFLEMIGATFSRNPGMPPLNFGSETVNVVIAALRQRLDFYQAQHSACFEGEGQYRSLRKPGGIIANWGVVAKLFAEQAADAYKALSLFSRAQASNSSFAEVRHIDVSI